jgi:RNA polymerase sigma-70 factor (TIGR02957 family)
VTDQATLVEVFETHRALLVSVAYRMLGSLAEAEDVVQEAWLRWDRTDQDAIEDARAFLVRVTTRLAIDRLRRLKARREAYVGPWLPEPILTEADAGDAVELAESVSLALLVVLETLSPLERAVFVLREAFGMSFAEVAGVLDRSEPAVRQLAHRAREHVQARRPRFDADRRAQQEVTERFFAACAGGDVEALMAALAPDVVLVSDGGGKAKAALRPITGADKVARFLVATVAQGLEIPDLRTGIVDINGAPGIVAWTGSDPFISVSLVVTDGRIEQVLIVRNPDKLGGLVVGGPEPT